LKILIGESEAARRAMHVKAVEN